MVSPISGSGSDGLKTSGVDGPTPTEGALVEDLARRGEDGPKVSAHGGFADPEPSGHRPLHSRGEGCLCGHQPSENLTLAGPGSLLSQGVVVASPTSGPNRVSCPTPSFRRHFRVSRSSVMHLGRTHSSDCRIPATSSTLWAWPSPIIIGCPCDGHARGPQGPVARPTTCRMPRGIRSMASSRGLR